jgi:hypothetical protein
MDKIRTNGLFLCFVNDGCNLEISKDGPVNKVGRVIRTFLLYKTAFTIYICFTE